jgi:hypothetical protein
MKLFKSPQKFLIIFLTSIIIVSFVFIVRLEIKAANLQTQWEEHQKSLKANEDVLMQLETFRRYVGNNLLKMDNKNIDLISGKSWLGVSNDNVRIESQGSLLIEATGDINITSKNGNVNIKGKKVNLNE